MSFGLAFLFAFVLFTYILKLVLSVRDIGRELEWNKKTQQQRDRINAGSALIAAVVIIWILYEIGQLR